MTDAELARLLDLDRSTLPADGGEGFNSLIFARSPYLLQHATQPVPWRQWGEEAIAEARARNVPLFVSIGYATCHWCHVMARESFSDPTVAALLQDDFIPVKIDREERPDLDELCMAASQALTGSGGWPLNAFLDHELRPFFTVTYLPLHPRHGAPSFPDLLRNMAILWKERPQSVKRNAEAIMEALSVKPQGVERHEPHRMLASRACHELARIHDAVNGGFGTAPKFPLATTIRFLLSRREPGATALATGALAAMARGGIQDQVGGGFHRYTVDAGWLVPHFEKMLYDQAQLIMAYCEGYAATGDRLHLDVARRTAAFALEELAIPEGAFCTALDADSEGVEGKFYLWDEGEIQELLGDEWQIWGEYWGIGGQATLPEGSVLHGALEPDESASRHGMTREEFDRGLERVRARLASARSRRVRPLRDLKVIAGLNGLMIAALATLATASGEGCWLDSAARAARFLTGNLVSPTGRLLRSWLREPGPATGFLEDYAYCSLGFLELAQAGGGSQWQDEAIRLSREMLRLFGRSDGSLVTAGSDGEQLPLSLSPWHDGALPSPCGTAALVLGRLGRIARDPDLTMAARNLVTAGKGEMERAAAGTLTLIMAAEELETAGDVEG
jgi:uncharacterized protein YyaL (SSP411 family)